MSMPYQARPLQRLGHHLRVCSGHPGQKVLLGRPLWLLPGERASNAGKQAGIPGRTVRSRPLLRLHRPGPAVPGAQPLPPIHRPCGQSILKLFLSQWPIL